VPIGGSFVRKIGTGLAVLAFAVFAMVFVAACGGSDDSGGGGGGGGKKGGSIKIGSVLPDNYDPVLYQTIQAYQASQLVYTPLTAFKHVQGSEGANLVPGLAEALPKITNGGKTYKLKMRSGLKYSDGSPIKASDFEHSVARLIKLAGPYSSFVSGIVGADKVKSCDTDISGIVADDKTGDITINLKAPDTKFQYALSEDWTAPTPAAKSPCKATQNPPPPGYGQYTIDIQNPTRQFTLTKNPKFKLPGIPAGNADKITVIKSSVSKMTQDVINGKLDFMTEDPTGDQLPQVRSKYPDRISLQPNPPNIYYFFLNVTTPPFNKIEARKAVNYAIDSTALQRIFSGRLEPQCTFIPPNVIGHKEGPCVYGDPKSAGNIDKAKALVKQSGTAGQSVTMWANNKDPRPDIADYMRDLLNQIGYKAKVKILDQQVYFDQVGQKRNKPQIGFTDWFMDFPHPSDLLEPSVAGAALASSPTFNTSYVNDPVLNKKIDALVQQDPKKVADQYADLDKYIVQDKAYLAPYGTEQSTSFFSDRMDAKNCNGVHPYYKNDWSLFCLK
jgi:peptide/nickel transport system substrate-binding protein